MIDNDLECSEKALGGVKKKSFKMAFGGGEIWFEHLDGIYEFTNCVLQKLEQDKKQFCRPSYPSLIAINLAQTDIDERIISALETAIFDTPKRFTKIVFVGVQRPVQKQIKKRFKLHAPQFAISFIDDFEKAKIWLVSENYS